MQNTDDRTKTRTAGGKARSVERQEQNETNHSPNAEQRTQKRRTERRTEKSPQTQQTKNKTQNATHKTGAHVLATDEQATHTKRKTHTYHRTQRTNAGNKYKERRRQNKHIAEHTTNESVTHKVKRGPQGERRTDIEEHRMLHGDQWHNTNPRTQNPERTARKTEHEAEIAERAEHRIQRRRIKKLCGFNARRSARPVRCGVLQTPEIDTSRASGPAPGSVPTEKDEHRTQNAK